MVVAHEATAAPVHQYMRSLCISGLATYQKPTKSTGFPVAALAYRLVRKMAAGRGSIMPIQ